MGHGDEFDFERSQRQARALSDFVNRHFRRARFGEAARPQQAGGEARRIDRAAETRPQRRDGADMVLMCMGDDEAEQILAMLLDECRIGQNQIDARHVCASEGDAAIDHDIFALFSVPKP